MTESDIIAGTSTRMLGKHVRLLDSIDSTNTFTKRLAEEDSPEGMLVLAEEQSAGRGRLGRTWTSSKGENLTFSLLLRPKVDPSRLGLLSLAAGVAVCETLRSDYGLDAGCKWPNDVLISGKKVCGILSEGVFRGSEMTAVVVGIGLNVNQSLFPPDLAERATSLRLAAGKAFERTEVLCAILGRLEELYDLLQRGGAERVVSRWSAASFLTGQHVRISGGGTPREGIIRGIESDGALLLETTAGLVAIRAGDVTLREP